MQEFYFDLLPLILFYVGGLLVMRGLQALRAVVTASPPGRWLQEEGKVLSHMVKERKNPDIALVVGLAEKAVEVWADVRLEVAGREVLVQVQPRALTKARIYPSAEDPSTGGAHRLVLALAEQYVPVGSTVPVVIDPASLQGNGPITVFALDNRESRVGPIVQPLLLVLLGLFLVCGGVVLARLEFDKAFL